MHKTTEVPRYDIGLCKEHDNHTVETSQVFRILYRGPSSVLQLRPERLSFFILGYIRNNSGTSTEMESKVATFLLGYLMITYSMWLVWDSRVTQVFIILTKLSGGEALKATSNIIKVLKIME